MSDPEGIVLDAIWLYLYSVYPDRDRASKEIIKQLRLQGWIRSVDERNRATGIS